VTERRQWLLAVVVAVLAILLGRGLLLASNDFFFVDRGLELPPTETPSQFVVPLLALAFHRLGHHIIRSWHRLDTCATCVPHGRSPGDCRTLTAAGKKGIGG
jgi:hypothetical protein